jgi:alpha-1,6-mannosyltransferase
MASDGERELNVASGAAKEALWVLWIGLASGLLYLVVYFAQQAIHLNGLHVETPVAVASGNPADGRQLVWEAAAYYAATGALFALYGLLLWLCRRGRVRDRRARNLALGFPILFNLGLLIGRPYLSIDVFSYIGHGYLGAETPGGAYLQETRTLADTSYALRLVPFGWRPAHGYAPYGPLWVHFEVAVVRLTDSVPLAMFLIKALVVLASLGAAAVIWRILARVRPEVQLLGTLVYLWNPMIVMEFAGEGHNDAPMILFVLLALLMAVQARPAPSVVMLALGVLTKYLPVLLFPAHIVYFWRTSQNRSRLLMHLLLGFLVAIGLAVLLYWPLWVGIQTFEGMRVSGQPSVIASIAGVLFWYLSESHSTEAIKLISPILSGIFGVYVLIACARVRDAESLLKACAGISLVYLLVGSPVYWPWYASMPLALMALTPHGAFRWMVLVLPLCSRIVAPIEDIMVNGFMIWETEVWLVTAIGVALPLLVFLLLSIAGLRAAHRPSRQSA